MHQLHLKENANCINEMVNNSCLDRFLEKKKIPQKIDVHILVDAITILLKAHDSYTAGHSMRVAFFSEQISRTFNRHESEHYRLHIAAHMHDIGKAAIPSDILNKKGKLLESEFELIRQHPQNGYDIMHKLVPLSSIAEIILCHHERHDGKGYPNGLRGKEIPLDARIIAVADAFDAMTSDRPYRKAFSFDKALGELSNESGTQFSPEIVERFINVFPNLDNVTALPDVTSIHNCS